MLPLGKGGVEFGYWISNPMLLLRLGRFWKVKNKLFFPVPVGDKLKFVEDSYWITLLGPRELVVKANQDKIGQPSKSKGEKTKSVGHSKGSDLCTSFGAMIGTIIQSGRF
ncbi:hypothetical protein IFM89_002235 [Coptis chinensis]|uniref:Uncharacterized protein n=1 Tax=Coptis chinensis TaxID=261450 RepID=A0A835IIJ4_9MAGN|nr:hypothetical protein IFM89_002235 [Coptis chinensis]